MTGMSHHQYVVDVGNPSWQAFCIRAWHMLVQRSRELATTCLCVCPLAAVANARDRLVMSAFIKPPTVYHPIVLASGIEQHSQLNQTTALTPRWQCPASSARW